MTEFQSRILYAQGSLLQHEEGEVNVSSTVYAIKYLYPGASQHTTSRIRITCTYKDEAQFEAHAGVIERWSDKGWMIIDDYTGDVYGFISELTFRKRLLDYAHSFIMGVPLSVINPSCIPDTPTSPTPRKINYQNTYNHNNKKEETKDSKIDNSKIEESKLDNEDDDSDDFYL